MANEFSALYEPLLDWVYERSEGRPDRGVELGPFATEHGLTGRADFELLGYAMSKGGLDNHFSNLGTAIANLTPEGLETAEQRRIRRESPVERSKAARRAVLHWLWLQDEDCVHWPVVENFAGTAAASFEGSLLTMDEIDCAAGYLKSHGLINGQGAWGRKGPLRAEITAEGRDCVENYDGDPRAYIRRGVGGTTYNNFLPNAQGVIIGEQQNVTQNNTAGVDPTLFVQLAGYVGQVSGTLGMDEPDREAMERVAQDLHAEATSPVPEPGRMRQLTTQLKDKLLEAGTTVAATMGVQMAEQALGSLM
ncbi:hypothetical protein [Streptomyces sp. NPDC052496]|uniref:hypothetical protein n=1 Tax=Streptomyces sp. NPDC052496 TaxID=3154951 RepID=UPI00341A4245